MADLGSKGSPGTAYVDKPREGGNPGQPTRPDIAVGSTSADLACMPSGTPANNKKPR